MDRRRLLEAYLREAESELAEELAAADRDNARVAMLQAEVATRRINLAELAA